MSTQRTRQKAFFQNLLIPRFWSSSNALRAHRVEQHDALFANPPGPDAPAAPLPTPTPIINKTIVPRPDDTSTGEEVTADPEKRRKKGTRAYSRQTRGQNLSVLGIQTGTGGSDKSPRGASLMIPG